MVTSREDLDLTANERTSPDVREKARVGRVVPDEPVPGLRALRHIGLSQPGDRRWQIQLRAKDGLGEQVRAEQRRGVGEDDDADLLVGGEQQWDANPGRFP